MEHVILVFSRITPDGTQVDYTYYEETRRGIFLRIVAGSTHLDTMFLTRSQYEHAIANLRLEESGVFYETKAEIERYFMIKELLR